MVSKIPSVILSAVLEQRAADKAESRVAGCAWVYVIRWQERGPTKVGVALDPRRRRASLQGGNPYPLEIFTAFGFTTEVSAYKVEAATLAALDGRRMAGEWLDATPLQVRDAVQQRASLLGLRPLMWEKKTEARDVRNADRARRAMEEYRLLNE